MTKKTIKTLATSFEEIDQDSGVEQLKICPICQTLSNLNTFCVQENKCIFCLKKTQQFGQIKVFTFKPTIYFLHKSGISKNYLEDIENDQMILGVKTDFIDYCHSNMIWYIYKDVVPEKTYNAVVSLFDMYKGEEKINVSHLKNTLSKFKHMFYKKENYISIQMIIPDVTSCELNFSKFLPRERIFI